MLEPCEGKLSCAVLRGESGSNTADLLDGLVEAKQKFIGQIMTSRSPARSIEDVDAAALTYAEVKMLATGDMRIKEKMDLDIQVTKLKMLRSSHMAQQYDMQDKVRRYYPDKMKETQLYIDCLNADLPFLTSHPVKEDVFYMTIMGNLYTDRREAGKALIAACRLMEDPDKAIDLGEYRGFPMKLNFDGIKFRVTMKQSLTYTAELSEDTVGNIVRINNALEKIPQSLEKHKNNLDVLHKELEAAREEADRPFPQEAELAEKSARLAELNAILDNEEKGRGQGQKEDGAKAGQEEGGTGSAQDTDKRKPGLEQGTARKGLPMPETPGARPSILKSIREYEPPAPAPVSAGRNRQREVI